MRDTIRTIADDLKTSPTMLALVIVVLLFLGVGIYTMREISSAAARRDQIVTDMIKRCVIHDERTN